MRPTLHLAFYCLICFFVLTWCERDSPKAQQCAQSHPQEANVKNAINTSIRLLNQFWKGVFQDAGLRYVPPSSVSGYTTVIETQCGNTLLNNAFYCPSDRSVQYDLNFMSRLQKNHGNYAIYTVMSHEWGHFISHTLNVDHRLSITEELQADCLAGGFVRWLSDQSPEDKTAYANGAKMLFLMGDRKNTPWFDEDAHGQPEERLRAFFHGYFSGYSACFQ